MPLAGIHWVSDPLLEGMCSERHLLLTKPGAGEPLHTPRAVMPTKMSNPEEK